MIEQHLNAYLWGEEEKRGGGVYAGMKPLKASIAITKPAA